MHPAAGTGTGIWSWSQSLGLGPGLGLGPCPRTGTGTGTRTRSRTGDNQMEYDYQLIIRHHIPSLFEKKRVRTKSDNLGDKVKKNEAAGPIPIDRARFSKTCGARISLWDALSVDFDAVLGFSHIPSIFQNVVGICLIIFYKKY